MSDPVSAVRDLLTGIPVKVRRTVYGLVGLVILVDGIWDFLPASIDDKVVTTFGVLGSVLARATDAPGAGAHWGAEAWHPHLPRGQRNVLPQVGSFAQVLYGPSDNAEGTLNIVGALRKAMATTGYSDVKEFQRVEMVVTA